MGRDPLIGIVGKPSSGKSTTLTDAAVKTGAFPFTTIDPNKATGYLKVQCACSRFGKQSLCKPNYGWCTDGNRHIPVLLLDVAGLVPGAHLGRGIGNKFLDDLRQADALIHVVDVSGSTDAEGKATLGYDPLADVEWLQDEIRLWIEGNLEKRWGSIVRRHTATKSSIVDTLLTQFAGYSANGIMIARAMDRVPEVGKLENWNKEDITKVVKAFMEEKFPTVLSLNKIDHPDSDKNVSKILLKYPNTKAVLTSAVTEVFLRRLAKQNYIKYEEGTEFVDTKEDLPDDETLKPMDEKLLNRLENIRDLILYRFGSTGVVQVLQAATEVLQLVPIYTVRNIQSFTGSNGTNVFRDCTLIRKGTPVSKVARQIMGDVTIAAIEGIGGVRVSEDDTIDVGKNDILSFKVVPGGGNN
ncbi:putative GTP-binding protein [Wickerhamomyces ciferrii]|uniref:GTP-binding protein n=1 Tax=Wickerhamomyces ciferrii (strain ATCC 14091 / BCRC 22168 / CBS 111 / JCM 3599 / NBRC 0793 / NRRL Y-1031 F-60-10) TaxID=1206466 RepID=K0KQ59_WICCF|nr:putative GTP-binding protein [Wickerhamomyces ciferrii]CCH43338.1 putative GTP-binding protein [Wickerhamomyces ciferrii]